MLRKIWIVGIFIALVFGACDLSSTASSSATATVPPTTAPSPTPTVSPALIAKCFGHQYVPILPAQVYQSGDLLIQQGFLTLAYPSVKLPDGTDATKPLKLTQYGVSTFYATNFPGQPLVNPDITTETSGSYSFRVCDTSASQSHVLQAVNVKLVAFTAQSGAIGTWNVCDPVLTSHHDLYGGGCGGAKAGCECFHAAFPANTPVGTALTVHQTGNDLFAPGDGKGSFPLTLSPGQAVELDVGLDQPTPAGLYTFQFGVTADSGPAVFGPATDAILYNPTAHAWTGQNCQASAFISQIAATTPESYYICP